jgi:hypothetical protein
MFSDIPRLQASEDEYAFWDQPEKWPHDPPGYLFLARACHEVGRAMFGAQWAESWGEPAEPPDDCDLATWEEYERKCGEYRKTFVAMRAAVVQAIAAQCEAGTLVAAVRPKAGGEMTKLEQHHWNCEGFSRRFDRCDMSLDRPFEIVGGSCRPDWIYIDRASLDGYLSRLAQSSPLPNGAAPDTSARPNAFHQPRDHKFLLAKRALVEIYSPNGELLLQSKRVVAQKWQARSEQADSEASKTRPAKPESG